MQYPRAATTLISIFILASARQAGAASDDGYILKQDSGVCGKTTIHVSSKGLKIERKNSDCVVLMAAPDWKLHIYNTVSRTVFDTDAKNWRGMSTNLMEGFVSVGRYALLNDKRVKPGTTKLSGFNCRETTLAYHGYLPTGKNRDKAELNGADYFGTTEVQLPPEAINVTQRFYRIPLLTGFPIKLDIFHPGSNEAKKEIETSSCVKAALPQSVFTVPPGYRLVTKENEVVVGRQTGLIEDMGEGLGDKFGSH